MTLGKIEFDLKESLISAFEIVIRRANEKGIKLLMDLDNNLPREVDGRSVSAPSSFA